MRVILHKKDLEITPALAEFVEKKLVEPVKKRLQNFSANALPLLDIEIGRSTRHHRKGEVWRAEANLTLNGDLLRAEARHEDIHSACDLLKEELLREITKLKSKQKTISKRKGMRAKRALEEEH